MTLRLPALALPRRRPAVVPKPGPAAAVPRPGRLLLARRAAVVAGTALAHLVPALILAGGRRLTRGRAEAERLLARRLVALLQRLGPTFIKGGQIVGTRRDVVPAVLCDALGLLADSVDPMTAAEAQRALDAVYGDAAVLADVDLDPVASGSVASVFRATLRDGREVAVKMQRPAIRDVMAADLALLGAVGSLAARLPALRGTPLRQIVGYLSEAIYAQLDFEREAASLARLRANLASVPRVWVPWLDPGASRPDAIVMEFIPQLDVNLAASATPVVRKRYAATTLAAVYHMLFIDGFVHCDLHRGNLYFTRRSQVVVLDAGFSVQLSERMRRLFAEFFMHMSLGNGEQCGRIVIESSSEIRPDADLDGFTRGMADLVDRNSGAAARDFSLIRFATEMFDLQRAHGLAAGTEIVFPLLSLLVIEGTIRALDPDIDFQEEAKPILMKAVFDAREAW